GAMLCSLPFPAAGRGGLFLKLQRFPVFFIERARFTGKESPGAAPSFRTGLTEGMPSFVLAECGWGATRRSKSREAGRKVPARPRAGRRLNYCIHCPCCQEQRSDTD